MDVIASVFASLYGRSNTELGIGKMEKFELLERNGHDAVGILKRIGTMSWLIVNLGVYEPRCERESEMLMRSAVVDESVGEGFT